MNDALLSELQEIGVLTKTGKCNGKTGWTKLKNNTQIYAKVQPYITSDVLAEVVYNIKHNITTRPTCKHCNSFVKFNSTKGYAEFCSRKCSNSNLSKKEKAQQTNLQRYGASSPLTNHHIREKVNRTNLQRYGSKSPLGNANVRQKARQTNLQRYGTEYHQLSDTGKQQRCNTNHMKYGALYPFNSKTIQQKAQHTIQSKYGVTSTAKLSHVKSKRKQTNIQRYEREYPSQRNIPNSVLTQLNNIDWITTEYNNKSASQIADDLNVDKQTVLRYLRIHDIEITSNHACSVGEQQLKQYIKSLGVYSIHNDRTLLHPQELDVYCPDQKIAFEYCGLYWHSDKFKHKKYHYNKWKKCLAQNVQLITIFEDEWFQKQNIVKQKIKTLLLCNDQQSIYARNCQIVDNIEPQTRQLFLNAYHIQGDGKGFITIGLQYHNELVSCMTFNRIGGITYLNRYATKYKIPGGFSKLLKYFIRTYAVKHNITQLVSFADARWSNGNLYKQTGWVLDSMLPVDYSYSPDGIHRYHKFNYRKDKLPNKLKKFDDTKSERINCDNNNILRIWDCGKYRFIYNVTVQEYL